MDHGQDGIRLWTRDRMELLGPVQLVDHGIDGIFRPSTPSIYFVPLNVKAKMILGVVEVYIAAS